MSEEAYELLAMGARYWFVLLGAVIVWRSLSWLALDSRARRRELRDLPDAGLVGEVVDLDTGRAYPLPYEGTLGGGRGCDVRIPGAGLKRRHLSLMLVRGKGMRVTLARGARAALDGVPISGSAYALHGARIETPGCELRVRLFAGLPVPRYRAYQPEDAPIEQNMPEPETDEAAYPFGTEEYPFEQQPAYDAVPGLTQEAYPFAAQEQEEPSAGDMTWPYAPYPPELLQEALRQASDEDMETEAPPKPERHRRAGRGRRGI